MSKVLVIAEHDGQTLNQSTAKTVACAADITGATIDVLVLAESAGVVAEQAAKLDAISRVLTVEHAANANALAAVLAPQIVTVAGGYSHVFGPSTTFGKDLMPRVAALLGVNQISDVMAVEDAHTFKRPIYAGNVVLTVKAPQDHAVVATVRMASYQPVESNNQVAIESVACAAEIPAHTRYVELRSGSSDRPDLQTAAKVVSGGRALASAENFEIIFELADKLGAGVGASRAAVDAGYVPERNAGRTNRQDHRARSVYRDRHFRCNSAPDRHQGRGHDRGDQQGRRSTDI